MMARLVVSIGLVLSLTTSAGVHPSLAYWSANGVAVCDTVGDQGPPRMTSDGAGGAIVVWQDPRAGAEDDIYSQHVTVEGLAPWPAQGVPVCVAAGLQAEPVAATDGAGGAIVAWQDSRENGPRIYAQRIRTSGTCAWSANGISLGSASSNQLYPAIASDGVGGAIVAWYQTPGDIYVQHIDANGSVLWDTAGVALCVLQSAGSSPRIASDGLGGALVTWADHRSGINQVFAARVQAAGTIPWGANGVSATNLSNGQFSPAIVSDGLGGAIVGWTESSIRAQRIDATGAKMWGVDGATSSEAAYPLNLVMVSDAAGGAIMAWEDGRYGDDHSAVFAQRTNAAGVAQWDPQGVSLSTGPDVQYDPAIVGDGAGGSIVAWADCCRPWWDIYAQRLNASGARVWNDAAVRACTQEIAQYVPAIVSDGAGGAIVAWTDRRDGQNDIYAQRIHSGGGVVAVPPSPFVDRGLAWAWPNPFTSQVRLAFHLPSSESVRLEVFDVQGRRVWASEPRSLESGPNVLDWNGDTKSGGHADAGVYYLQARGSQVLATRRVVYLH